MTGPPPEALALAEAALGRAIGLRAEAAMRGRLERCLSEAAGAVGEDVLGFSRRLSAGGRELQLLCDLVTVQETWFFREAAQFAALADHLARELAGRPVTVWSAGCANGQEAYSLAMVLADSPVASWRVVATDVSTRALERSRTALYAERELRGLDGPRRDRYLRPAAGGFQVVPELREHVEVRRHNLTTDMPPGVFDVVFCRNVVIYLQDDEVDALLSRLAGHLAPGGLLFLASSDAGGRAPAGFELVRHGDAFLHRRRGGGAAPSRLPAATPSRRVCARGAGRAGRSHAAGSGGTPPRRGAPPAAIPDVAALLDAGERAAAAGELQSAARAFRQAVYLAPDHGGAHVSLGLVLEAAGDDAAAARAFAAARAALRRIPAGTLEDDVDDADRGALAQLLAARMEEGG
jgi:chemotaxis methyl-accepting protein methylase